MAARSRYKTRQREVLLGYFETVPGVHLTAAEVLLQLRARGESIGQSTVYRQLESLVDEGLLKKYIVDESSPACFEYVDPDSHGDAESCFHCKCEKCGRLIHLHCGEMDHMQAHLILEHSFQLDMQRTVLYGLCEQCRGIQ